MRSISHARVGVHPKAMLRLCGIALLFTIAGRVGAQGITLADALSRAMVADPVVQANNAHLQAAKAAIDQADIRPRDSVGVDIEDFVGTGPYSSLSRSQTTGWYERTWEGGGKRQARIAAAQADVDVLSRRARLRRLDRMAIVQESYVEAQAAAARVPVAEAALASAQAVQSEVNRRVAAAVDPLFAAQRARTAVAEARIALDQAREAARLANVRLAAWWGGADALRPEMEGFLNADRNTPAAIGPAPAGGPDLAMFSAAQHAAAARVRLADSANSPDVNGRIGLRHFSDGSDVALVVGGSVQLGSRAANRGNASRARAEQEAASAELAVARHDLAQETRQLAAERALIAAEAGRIETEVIPGAGRALDLARAGFARGGTAFTFLEISQAQQALNDARMRRVELLRRYHLAGVRLDRLSGRHLSLIASEEIR